MKMPRDGARVRRCSRKASAKRNTIKCVRHPGLRRRATKKSHNSRACRGNSGCARKNSRTRLNRKKLPEQEQKVVWATHFAPAADLFTQKVEGTAWKSKPSWYVVATSDPTVQPELQRFVAKRMGATTYEVDSGHVPMRS